MIGYPKGSITYSFTLPRPLLVNNTLVKSGEVRPRTLLNTVLGLTSHDLTNVIYRVVAGKENAGLGTLVYTFPAQHLLTSTPR